jgi:dTDP-4-amino-4,6-dideoxygalactose transaminase
MAGAKTVPMLDLKREYEYMKDEVNDAIERCLKHQKWILGPEVKELEERVALYIGAKHCIGVSSGTDALVIALRALAIKLKGQEYFDRADHVITTPFTFTATGDAILRSGATPVFVDIDPLTYNIDPVQIDEYVAQHPRVVGIIPVHLYGGPCDMGEIMEIAGRYGLFVVEDTAQAFGGTWQGKKLGSIGTVGAFSFFPSKNLGGFGDGGMTCTDDDEIAELTRMLLKHGGKDKYDVDHIGYNGRLDTLQAAILLAKLAYIDELNERRRRVSEIYGAGLCGISGIALPTDSTQPQTPQQPSLPDGHVFHQYTLRIGSGKRDMIKKVLKDKGISTTVYYPVPLHKMKVFGEGRSVRAAELRRAEEASATVLSLPIEPLQEADETAYVVETLKGCFGK